MHTEQEMAWCACDQEKEGWKQTQAHPTVVLFYRAVHKAHQNLDEKATFFFWSQKKSNI